MPTRLRPLLAFLLLIFALTACSSEEEAAPPADPLPLEAYLPLTIGDQTIQAQLAITTPEQMRGLMHREHMETDHGMIFVYPKPQQMNFWMKNTLIPLDIGYIDSAGVLREIYPMYPRDTTPVPSRSDQIQWALEMNQGWFARVGLKPGAQLDMESLAAALTARGASPVAYGLNSAE